MKFRKKPVIIEAFRWTGGPDQTEDPVWIIDAIQRGIVFFTYDPETEATLLRIRTLEGTMTAAPGDWIIKGVEGEIYPCKPSVFETTYEAVDAHPV